jgi:hypothetical protein
MITIKELKEFCKLAGLKISGSKNILIDRVDEYLNKYKYAPRYMRGLSEEEKFEKKFDIKYYQLKEKKTGEKKYSPIKTDKSYKTYNKNKISKYTEKWNKEYPDAKTLKQKSKISGVPIDILEKVNDKGMAAWRGGQHRPGASQKSWGISRVNSFLTCGKTFYFPDHELVKDAMKRSPRSKKFWEEKGCKFSKLGKRTPSR